MTELEKALLHIKTRADAWAVKVVKDALSQEPTVTSTDEPMTMVYPTIVCDDAISRDAVIKDFTQWRGKMAYSIGEDYSGVSVLDKAIRVIKGMPSVTQKTGKWLKHSYARKCSECGSVTCWTDEEWIPIPDNYCPNCGAKMVEPQESEDKE